MVNLLANETATWSLAGPSTGSQSQGIRFSVSADQAVNAIGWYALDTNTGHWPERLRLWDDSNTSTPVIDQARAVSPAGAGWVWETISGGYTLVAGHTYRLVWCFATGDYYSRSYPTAYQTPPAPFSLVGSGRCQRYGDYNYPADDNGAATAITITSEGVLPPAPTPAQVLVYQDLSTELQRWFSGTDETNTHHSDTPWSTLQDVLTWLSRGGTITGGDATEYGLRDATLAGALVKILDYLVANGSNINGLITALNTVKGWLGQNGSAPGTWDLYGQVQDMSTQLYAIRAKVDAMTTPPPPSSWVSQGTTTFDTNLAWAQAADVYTVTYSDLGSAKVNLTIGAADVAYRLAWWSIWDGERMRERRFADGTLPVLYDGGARMPGLILHSPAGASGTVEAWALS